MDQLIQAGTEPDNQNVFKDGFEYPMFVGEDGHTEPGEEPDDDEDDDDD